MHAYYILVYYSTVAILVLAGVTLDTRRRYGNDAADPRYRQAVTAAGAGASTFCARNLFMASS